MSPQIHLPRRTFLRGLGTLLALPHLESLVAATSPAAKAAASAPVRMAFVYVPNGADMANWTPEKIDSAMNSGKEKFVSLKTPVPVIITYYTSWIDKKGKLHFANDIYGHDKEMARKMFTDPQ